jgi:F0F1-type ATP synthase assembly protein I
MSSEPEKRSAKNKWVGIESYIQLGVLLPAATFIGWLIGHLLDLHFHTHWIYLVGLGLGIAAGFVQLFRVTLKAGDD